MMRRGASRQCHRQPGCFHRSRSEVRVGRSSPRPDRTWIGGESKRNFAGANSDTNPVNSAGLRLRPYLLEIRSVPVTVCDSPLDTPETMNVNVPRGLAAVVIVSRETPFPVTELGENVLDEPDGSPLTDSATVPENPFNEPSVIV